MREVHSNFIYIINVIITMQTKGNFSRKRRKCQYKRAFALFFTPHEYIM